MDTLTHALVGATISNLGFKKAFPGATFTLVAASAMPDIDWASRFFGIVAYLRYHRAFTHSLLGVVLLAVILTLMVKVFCRQAEVRTTFLLSLFGGLFHLLMDLINPFGTQIFYPLLSERYAWNWVTVMDLYVTIPLVASLLLLKFTRWSASKTAAVALGFVILVISTKGICHQIASEKLGELRPPQGQTLKVRVYPDFFSPFTWKGVVESDSLYQIVTVNLLSATLPTPEDYIKPERNEFTELAEKSDLVKAYLEFARHPLSYQQELGGYHFVSWQDLAYAWRGRRGMVVEVLISANGEILHQRFSFSDPKLHPERLKRLIQRLDAR